MLAVSQTKPMKFIRKVYFISTVFAFRVVLSSRHLSEGCKEFLTVDFLGTITSLERASWGIREARMNRSCERIMRHSCRY